MCVWGGGGGVGGGGQHALILTAELERVQFKWMDG